MCVCVCVFEQQEKNFVTKGPSVRAKEKNFFMITNPV